MSFESSVYSNAPYYDDFNAANKFLRILFRPGYSVQARELTQIQTILQGQIKMFGDHIFENGSLVAGGQITESTVEYARIVSGTITQSTNNGASYSAVALSGESAALAAIIGTEFGVGNGNYNAGHGRIIHTIEKNDTSVDTYHYVFFQYLTGATTLDAGETLEVKTVSGTRYRFVVKSASPTNLPATGKARAVTTQPGIYFVDGSFVLTEAQTTCPYNIATASSNIDGSTTVATGGKMFENPTARVGFTVSNEIITSFDDSTLLDPANGFSNFAAPGADRLKKTLVLGFTEFLSDVVSINAYASDEFVEILRYEDGVVTKKEIFPDYAKLEETFARRTFDESGNYTVVDFGIQMKEHLKTDSDDDSGVYLTGDESKLVAVLDPGKAYIGGFEFETIARTYIALNKARSYDSISDKIVDVDVGSYVIIGNTTATPTGFGDGVSVLNNSNHPLVWLGNSVGISFGTALFRQLDVESAITNEYRLYLYDIELNSGGNFADTTYVFATSGDTIGVISPVNGVDLNSNAVLFNQVDDTLVIPLPVDSAIRTVLNADYDVQLSFAQTASGGSIQVSVPSKSGDPITFPGDLNALVATSLLNNRYFLIDVTQEDYISSFTGITFTTSNDNETLTVAGLTNGNSYRVLANCEVNTTNSSFFYRTKTLNTSEAVNGVTLSYDSFSGLTTGDLGVADVYVLESIFGEVDNPGVDLTDRFYLDDGQRDTLYDHAKIVLKSGFEPGDSSFTVNLRRFTHTGDGPFVVNSYPVGTAYAGITFAYENIPSFKSNKTGKTVSLRDCLDFRPVKSDAGIISGSYIPVAKESMSASFEYYLPRIDRITLTKDREFKVVTGIPSLNPKAPFVDAESMPLFTLRLGSWTFGPEDVQVQHHNTKRYTMQDIGKIEQRVSDIEYYTSLTALENEANSRTFLTDSNIIIPKVGIIVDNFDGHELGDVNNQDYNCSMDFEEGVLRPAFKTRNVSLVQDTSTSVLNATKHTPAESPSADTRNDLYTLSYTQERSVSNPMADTIVPINPTGNIEWYGYMSISPSSDDWMYESKRPNIRSNKYGINDAWAYRSGTQDYSPFGFGTQYRDWEYNWFGREKTELETTLSDLNASSRVFDSTFEGSSTAIRTKSHEFLFQNQIDAPVAAISARNLIARNSTPDSILKTYNEMIVNDSIDPYGRGTIVYYTLTGMKPSTTVYLFADNESKGTVVTDTSGKISGTIVLNSGEFKSGEILLRALDDSENNIVNATTVSEATFKIAGVGALQESGILSSRPTIKRRKSLRSSNIVASTVSRNAFDGSGISSLDGMAQIFTVDRNKHAKGMFVKSVDVMFAEIPDSDDEKSLPVTLEIRPVVSGYPHPSKIVPGSVSHLYPDDITVATSTNFEGTSNRTTFEFNYPVYLQPGEYAIILKSNSNNYKIYTATLGNSLASSERITQQPHVGKFFIPQNAGSYIPDDTKRLSFAVNRCKFTTSTGTIVFRNRSGEFADNFNFDEYYIHSGHIDLGRTGNDRQLSFQIQTTDRDGSLASSPSDVSVNQTVSPLDSRGTQIVKASDRTVVLTATMVTDDDAISPVIDLQRLSFLGIQNLVNESSSVTSNRLDSEYNGELDPIILDTINTTKVSLSRYITKTIVLDDLVSATDLRVILDVNQPFGTKVQVFAKTLESTDVGDFDSRNYVELLANTTLTSSGSNKFTELTYSPSDSDVLGEFKAFSIKIVLHTSDEFVVPKVRNMRVIALA